MGGAELMLVDLIKGLAPQYHQKVLYIHDGPVRQQLEHLGIACTQITSSRMPLGLNWWRSTYKYLKHEQPDLVMSSLWAANLLTRVIARTLRIPHMNIIHAQPEHEGAVRNWIDRITMRLAQQVITVAPRIEKEIVSRSWIPAQRIATIPNGIAHTQATHQITRHDLGLLPDDFVIGAVGRFVPVKNFEALIYMTAQLLNTFPHIKLVLVGTGPLEQKLRELVRDNNVEKHTHFIINQPAINYYQLFDCFVQPSWSEGLSRALLEALSFSLPVIVSSTEGSHDVITHKTTGLIINPHHEQELSQALTQLLTDQTLRKKLAHAGHELVTARYSQETMIKAFQKHIELQLMPCLQREAI